MVRAAIVKTSEKPKAHRMNNPIKTRLKNLQPVLGTWIRFGRTPALIRMIRSAGFDFVFIDAKHSNLNVETVSDFCEMARAIGLTPIVRPPSIEAGLINRYQDAGAQGLLFADVTSSDEVATIRDTMLFPPDGSRGAVSGGALTGYGRTNVRDAFARANANTIVAIQIESRKGMESLDDILGSAPIDFVEVGRNDLSTSLGMPGQLRSTAVLEELDRVVEKCKSRGIAVGVNATSHDDCQDLVSRGVTVVSYSSDQAILEEAYSSISTTLEACIDGQCEK